ncbi:M56 family metallopeptidase [uncultured Chitinophaga sp.]|uniref:M56 family metallopeptidase n=1 Tax=uncultured Chitinophaga sp. TaxID=339340 RepID=UPI0025F610CA|nr:M56 family metallopeptidase [uncultured Chitinophaga sp.]
MTPFITYLLKVIVCSGVLYGYYYLALRNNKFHQWNRYYLLFTTLLSLVIPLLKIPIPFTEADTASPVYTYTAQLVTLRESVLPAAKQVNYFEWSTWIYLVVIGVLLSRIAYGCWRIMSIARHNPVQYVKPYWFVVSEKVLSPFSFFRYIFWNRETNLDSEEGQQILQHELAHLTERHSIDKLALEIVTALCWINPFFHLAKRELALIHEFIADKKAAANGEVAGYARTILQMALGSTQFTLTNNFFHPPIKRRILMLTQSKQPKFSYLRRIMILPLGAVIFASLSFVVDKSDIAGLKAAFTPSAVMEKTTTPATAPKVEPAFSSTSIQLKEETRGRSLDGTVLFNGAPVKNATVLVKGTTRGTITDENGAFELTDLPENAVIAISCVGYRSKELPVGKGYDGTSNILIQLERDNKAMDEIVVVGYGNATDTVPEKPATGKKSDNNEIFSFVEQPPKYPGGSAELNKYLARHIRYPQTAVKNNIQGTVFVSFVVDQDGTITDVRTVGKARGAGLEEEAIRVVKGMPAWTPGMQNGQNVSVQFNLPIRFALNTGDKTAAPAKPATTTKVNQTPDANGVYTFVQQAPTFPGGEKAMMTYLGKTVRYPEEAVKNNKKGTVFVTFIVRESGNITDVATVGAKKGFGLDEEAIRAIKGMPEWQPGTQDGKPVAVRFNVPVNFQLSK